LKGRRQGGLSRSVRFRFLYFLGQRRKDREEIADKPKSATRKIGASGSLLMATMCFDDDMPARCWIAPEDACGD